MSIGLSIEVANLVLYAVLDLNSDNMKTLRIRNSSDIIEKDQSIIAPWKVRRRLDLENVETAFRYMDRYAKDVIRETEVETI